MSSLSSLLNPEPAATDSSSSPEARKHSAPSLQQNGDDAQGSSDGQAYAQAPAQAQPQPQLVEYHTIPTETARDATQALAALSSSNAPPPSPWHGFSMAGSHSPTDTRRLSTPRRSSTYGEHHANAIELPQPPDVAPTMSSPTLDHYHVASRSPEHYRRPSFVLSAADQHLTLPPIQSLDSLGGQSSVGLDSSVIISPQNAPEQTLAEDQDDVVARMQQLSDSREPAYIRQDPSTTQIREPSVSDSPQPALESPSPKEAAPSSDNLKADTEPTQAPTQSSLTALKHEHSAHAQSPLRDSSVPVQSTETPDMPVASRRPAPSSSVPRKRPPPKSASGKKGTASTVRSGPPAKKRKTDAAAATAVKRSGTPSTQKQSKGPLSGARKLASASATPANSSPAPRSVRNGSTPPRSGTSADPEADPEAQYSGDEDDDEDHGTPDPDADLYCLCRRPDTGTFMIGCDGGCDDWFHGKCVGIAERDKGLIDRYVCPRCTENNLGPTTWKRMCRRNGCRLPARTPKSGSTKKGKKEQTASKYCSDACGTQYFKDMVAHGRQIAHGPTQRPKSKKGSDLTPPSHNEDLGPRGGILSAGELRALVNMASGVDEFKRFGEGILSPPATPSPTRGTNQSSPHDQTFTTAEQEQMTAITNRKDATRARHALLKDRFRFITMLKDMASKIAEGKGIKPKDFCGFDPRLTWTEDEFNVWRASPSGIRALRSGNLGFGADAEGDVGMSDGDATGGENDPSVPRTVCDKRRCARHHEWTKLTLDDTRFEMSENSEVMRSLDKDEKDLLQRAGFRARVLKAGGSGGDVVVHPDDDDEVHADEPHDEEEDREATAPEITDVATIAPGPILMSQEAGEGQAVSEDAPLGAEGTGAEKSERAQEQGQGQEDEAAENEGAMATPETLPVEQEEVRDEAPADAELAMSAEPAQPAAAAAAEEHPREQMDQLVETDSARVANAAA